MVPPDSMQLEVANRYWMVHQMLLSEYFINNHRMRVSVLLMLLLRGISLDLCELCYAGLNSDENIELPP